MIAELMLPQLLSVAGILLVLAVVAAAVFTRKAMHWGATPEERAMRMAGDEYLVDGPAARVVMTRAVFIAAPPDVVWPWLAQLGRGAGWYSLDRLDNGGKRSARHILTWVPAPCKGDASPIGYLRHIVPGRQLTWWAPGVRFIGATTRLAVDILLDGDDGGSRLVIRMSADAEGAMARPALWIFRFMDSIMARNQIMGIRERVERHGARASDPDHPESGARDQYQLYEVIYASGDRAGTPGKERAEHWRRIAIEARLLSAAKPQ